MAFFEFPEERKLATILFADISGFTELSHAMEPEEVSEVINICSENINPVIIQNNGLIHKYQGDTVIALFGIPAASEDDTENAVKASKGILNIVPKINSAILEKTNYKSDIGIHIGINCGIVAWGEIGSELKKEHTVLGDAVNLASRIMNLAGKNEIYVSESVFLQTSHFADYKDIGNFFVKGIREKLRIYAFISFKEFPESKRGIKEKASRFIGREETIKNIGSAIDNMPYEKKGAVFILGDAGIGKTRFIKEFKNSHLPADNCFFTYTQCAPACINFPDFPIIDTIEKLFGFEKKSSNQEKKLKIRNFLGEKTFDKISREIKYIYNLLSILDERETLSLENIDPKSLKQETNRALLEIFRLKRKLIAVIDDAHWIDSSSADFLKFFFNNPLQVPVLFILLSRTEKRNNTFEIIEEIKKIKYLDFAEFRLEPLDVSHCREILLDLMPQHSSDEILASKILEKSGGNPFFLEEIVKDIKERETVDKDILYYKEGFSLPDSVFSVLFSRLDRLEPQKKKILQASSVIGANFTESLLSEIVFQDSNRISEQLFSLAEHQYIVKQNGSYSFKHPLILETTYKTIVKKDKKLLHIKTAQALEKIAGKKPKNYHEDLSFHYLKSEVWDKAYEHSMISAKKAAENYQNDLSLKFYENAAVSAERLFDKKKRIIADLGKSKILSFIGRSSEALETTKTILKEAQKINDESLCAEICLFISELYSVFSDYKKMLRHSLPLLDFFKEEKNYRSYAYCLHNAGKAYFYMSDYVKSLKYLKESFNIFDMIDDKIGVFKTLNTIGLTYFELSDYKNSLLSQKKALQKSGKFISLMDRSQILTSLAFVYFKLCSYRKAEVFYKKSLKIKKEIGHLQGYAYNIAHLGILYYITNDYEKAMSHFENSLKILYEMDETKSIANINYYQACIHYRLGHVDKALSILKKCSPMSKKIGDIRCYSSCLMTKAQIYAETADYPKAESYFSENLKINSSMDDRAEISRNLLSEAKMLIKKGDLSKAQKKQNRAVQLMKNLDLPEMMFRHYSQLSIIQLINRKPKLSLKYLAKAEKYEKEIKTSSCQAYLLQIKGRILTDMNDFDGAEDYFIKSEKLFKKVGESLNLAETYYYHGKLYKKAGRKDDKTPKAEKTVKDLKLSKSLERKILKKYLK
ncbi:tetratricopeptide repeat protein [candidate division WOR-3 bacterium]|nr:tetratricopeptide repeat protein [candidate division WOR-3 bacterium]